MFLLAVLTLLTIVAALMYLIEGEENGFSDIPTSFYWAVVTLTTVGFGDIAPKTAFGRAAASVVMIIGYGIIAVPTGIVTVELTRRPRLHGQRAMPDLQPDRSRCRCTLLQALWRSLAAGTGVDSWADRSAGWVVIDARDSRPRTPRPLFPPAGSWNRVSSEPTRIPNRHFTSGADS